VKRDRLPVDLTMVVAKLRSAVCVSVSSHRDSCELVCHPYPRPKLRALITREVEGRTLELEPCEKRDVTWWAPKETNHHHRVD